MEPREGGWVDADRLGGWILEEGCKKFKEMGLEFELKSKKKKKKKHEEEEERWGRR